MKKCKEQLQYLMEHCKRKASAGECEGCPFYDEPLECYRMLEGQKKYKKSYVQLGG